MGALIYGALRKGVLYLRNMKANNEDEINEVESEPLLETPLP